MKKPFAIALVLVVALFALGFRVAHPQGGLNSAMGSAKSSIVLYKKVGQAMPGDKVIVPAPKTIEALAERKGSNLEMVDWYLAKKSI